MNDGMEMQGPKTPEESVGATGGGELPAMSSGKWTARPREEQEEL